MGESQLSFTTGMFLRRVLAILALYTALSSAGCYAPDGTYEPDDVPCFPDQEDSFCCQVGYACLSNKLCYATSASKDYDPSNPNGRTRRGCTDPSWASPECPQFCLEYRHGGEGIDYCNQTSSTQGAFCCTFNFPDCECLGTGQEVFLDLPTTITVIPAGATGGPTTLVSAAASSSASSSSSSSSSSSPSSSSSSSPASSSSSSSSSPSSPSSPPSSASSPHTPNTNLQTSTQSTSTQSTSSTTDTTSSAISAIISNSASGTSGSSGTSSTTTTGTTGTTGTASASTQSATPSNNSNSPPVVPIAVGIVVPVVVIAAAVFGFLYWRRHRAQSTSDGAGLYMGDSSTGPMMQNRNYGGR